MCLQLYMFPHKATGIHGQDEVGMGNLEIRLGFDWIKRQVLGFKLLL